MTHDLRLTGHHGASAASGEPPVRVLVLGVLALEAGSREVHVAGSHRRRLLALLASRPQRMVSVDAIVDALWGDAPPPTAAKTVQSHVVRLRRSLSAVGTDLIETVRGGYQLAVDPASVDAVRFERLAADGHRELARGAIGPAAELLGDALDLWRGPAYVEFGDAEFAAAERVRLDELRLRAGEDLAEAQIAGGTVAAAIPDLERLVVEEPGRERAWALLMRALYAAGRQHHALVAYQRARRALVESFGLEPGPELRALERQILDQDPELIVIGDRPRVPAALRTSGPLVGRGPELAWLTDAWESARDGTGQVRVLLGPADSGRTRLVAELAAQVITDGGWVEYVHGGADLSRLVPVPPGAADETPAPPGAVLDAISDRCRRGPLLLVLDDMERMPLARIAGVEAVAAAAERLSLLLVPIVDEAAGGAAIGALQRLPNAATTTLGPLPDGDLARIVVADGLDDDAVAATVAVAGGLPGVARREAAAWAERAASDRLHAATASSLGATAAADEARASVFDEVLALVAARDRRDELVSASLAGRQPYRALAAYGPEDADLFVGRERLVAELAARVLDRRLVVVVGASGSGKSSLVRAGLLPLVRSGRLPGKGSWWAKVIVPDDAGALERLEELDVPGPHLLIVDQFEEAITGGTAEALANRLVNLVLDAALDIHVVLVVRADQYGALTTIRPLADLLDDAQLTVGPPTDDELRRIIEVPAHRTGCVVERTLTDLVLDEVDDYEAALPLVSAALAEVWNSREEDTLTAERYLEIGGVAAAVERLGERAVERNGDEERIREVMMRLVDVTDDGQWVRRRLPVDEMPGVLSSALDALVDARLVQRDHGEIDVVHEVVFRAWPRLVEWLEEARTDLVLGHDLRVAARTWDAHGRSDDDVYRGARLAAAGEFLARHRDVGELVGEFVAAGQRVADRAHEEIGRQLERESRARRRLGRALAAAAVLLVAALVGGSFALVNERRADEQRQRAADAARLAEERLQEAETAREGADAKRDEALIARLVAESERRLDSRLDLALLLAVEARRRARTPETDGALLTALTDNLTTARSGSGELARTHSSFVGFLAGPPRMQFDVDISADGRIVASGGVDEAGDGGLVLVFDTSSRQEVARIEVDQRITQLDVADDGRHVLARDGAGGVWLLDVDGGTTEPVPVAPIGGGWTDAFFRGDDQFILSKDGDTYLWSVGTMEPVGDSLLVDPLGFAGFAPGGTLVAADPTRAVFWDIDRDRAVRQILMVDMPQSVATEFTVSPDGTLLAGADDQGAVYVWDLATGRLLGDAASRPQAASGIAFSPTSPGILAVGTTGGGVALEDVQSERFIGEPLDGHGSATRDVAFSADGRFLVTIADDGLIGLWGPNGRTGSITTLVDRGASNPSYSSDGRRVAIQVGGQFEVRDPAAPRTPGVSPQIYSIWPTVPRLSADGSAVLMFSESGDLNVLDAATGDLIWSYGGDKFLWTYAALSPDARTVAAVDDTYGRIQAWDVRTGAELADGVLAGFALDLDPGVSGQPVFSGDGRYLDVPTTRGVARFGARDLRPVRFAAATQNIQGVHNVPGTSDLIGVGVGGRVWRWDMDTGELIVQGRSRDSSSLINVVVSPDGSMLAAYHPFSAQLALFDAASLRPIGRPFPVGDKWFRPQFTADGRFLAGNGLFNGWTRWDVDPVSWQASACLEAGRNLTRAEWSEYVGSDVPYRATCPEWPPDR